MTMLPYSRGVILDNTNNYGIVKTETVFGFVPPNTNRYFNDSYNITGPLEWIFSSRSLDETYPESHVQSRALKPTISTQIKSAKHKKLKKKLKRNAKGVKKCVFKILKGKGKRKGSKSKLKGHMKYILPLFLGVMAAKSLLVPIALKALAFLSAKGLMMGFFSTVLASVLSLKGMFDSHHGYAHRKDDSKTQVEIIQVPTKSEDHIYYDDVHYKRGDYNPGYNYRNNVGFLALEQKPNLLKHRNELG